MNETGDSAFSRKAPWRQLIRIRWGIVGCGDVTEVKSGPAFQKAEGSQLVAVMRRNGALAEDYARRHGVPKWYDNAQRLIEDPEVDAVYIATPPSSHCEYTLMAAKAGKPVYVEKPMARTYAECETMIAACKEAGVPLFVAYYRRAQPRFAKIKELLDSGTIGTIRSVSSAHFGMAPVLQPGKPIPWRLQPEEAGGGLFYDLASHTLDILAYLLGPIESVFGFASNQAQIAPAEDIVTGTYRFASGAHGVGTWCFNAFRRGDLNEIVGDQGSLTFSTFDNVPIRVTTSSGVQEWDIPQPQHVEQPLIQHIVNELLGKGRSPSTGETGARTNWVMEQMVKNYYHS